MGDRAVIIVRGAAAAMYTHWGGNQVSSILAAAIPKMRVSDPDYAQACLIAHAYDITGGDVGMWDPPADYSDATLERWGDGDAGVFVIDPTTGAISTYAGYGFGKDGAPKVRMGSGR